MLVEYQAPKAHILDMSQGRTIEVFSFLENYALIEGPFEVVVPGNKNVLLFQDKNKKTHAIPRDGYLVYVESKPGVIILNSLDELPEYLVNSEEIVELFEN